MSDGIESTPSSERRCNQCSTCAFRDGGDANLEPENHLKGLLTVLAGSPFYCHEGLDWQRDATETQVPRARPELMRRRLVELTLPGHTATICQGWKKAVGAAAAQGWYRGEAGRVRRVLALTAIGHLYRALALNGNGIRTTRKRRRALESMGLYVSTLISEAHQLAINPETLGLYAGADEPMVKL